ncbi:STAS domain-containing protein [Micromonospora sp. CPCC 205711]|uniref:STAS domain-containing protein n=1 Tax=Micromonospora sp. CPCC 205547 TaxID=3122400 RepID=UPI002FEFE928
MGQCGDRFHVQLSVADDAVEVRAVGEIDIATVGAFRAALWAAPARPVLRVDLAGVRLFSAAGVRALVAAHLRVRARGGELVVVDPGPMVARVLRATGLHRVIPVRKRVPGGPEASSVPSPSLAPGAPVQRMPCLAGAPMALAVACS